MWAIACCLCCYHSHGRVRLVHTTCRRAEEQSHALTPSVLPWPQVYTEKTPLGESEVPVVGGGQFKKINWLKAGILAADKVLTVSPNYATEITSDSSGGVELDTYLRAKVVMRDRIRSGASCNAVAINVQRCAAHARTYVAIPGIRWVPRILRG
jgi:hypothetical protein